MEPEIARLTGKACPKGYSRPCCFYLEAFVKTFIHAFTEMPLPTRGTFVFVVHISAEPAILSAARCKPQFLFRQRPEGFVKAPPDIWRLCSCDQRRCTSCWSSAIALL